MTIYNLHNMITKDMFELDVPIELGRETPPPNIKIAKKI